MESRLKERLTGAAILVALIVLIVPEIFHDRRDASTPTGVATPARATAHAPPTRSYTIELAPPAALSRAEPAPAKTLPGTPGAIVPAGTEPGPAPAAARHEAGTQAHPEGRREAHTEAGVPAATAATAAHRSGGWTVQLGLFSKSDNAERLERTARSRGFAVQISRVGARRLYRVAVSGVADRAAAEQVSHRLRGAGLPAAIIGPR